MITLSDLASNVEFSDLRRFRDPSILEVFLEDVEPPSIDLIENCIIHPCFEVPASWRRKKHITFRDVSLQFVEYEQDLIGFLHEPVKTWFCHVFLLVCMKNNSSLSVCAELVGDDKDTTAESTPR
jgi:hypothetical protein